MRRQDPAAIEAEIDQLRSLPLDTVRRRWQVMFGRKSPANLSSHLLRAMIACRIQEQACGGLDRDSLRFLANRLSNRFQFRPPFGVQ
jgi:hypothetical protein